MDRSRVGWRMSACRLLVGIAFAGCNGDSIRQVQVSQVSTGIMRQIQIPDHSPRSIGTGPVCGGPGLFCDSGDSCGQLGCCPADHPVSCLDHCCLGGTTCAGVQGGDCVAPPGENNCDGFACGVGVACANGFCPTVCGSSDFPTICGVTCCKSGIACDGGGVCACPNDHPVACGDRCCLAGARCNSGGCGCPAGTTPCAQTCCGPNRVCTPEGCLPPDGVQGPIDPKTQCPIPISELDCSQPEAVTATCGLRFCTCIGNSGTMPFLRNYYVTTDSCYYPSTMMFVDDPAARALATGHCATGGACPPTH
jgi:hypothetical protein